MENLLNEVKNKMEKTLQALKQELSITRTGRASLSVLDAVRVDYYGTLTPLNQVATLKIPEAKLITIQPWEPKLIPEIEKGIAKASIGLSPSNDGKIIRLPIPSLSEERRKELVKLIKKQGEECRVGIRSLRRDANEAFKKREKEKEITQDDLKTGEERIQKLTDEYNAKIDELLKHKEQDIMTV